MGPGKTIVAGFGRGNCDMLKSLESRRLRIWILAVVSSVFVSALLVPSYTAGAFPLAVGVLEGGLMVLVFIIPLDLALLRIGSIESKHKTGIPTVIRAFVRGILGVGSISWVLVFPKFVERIGFISPFDGGFCGTLFNWGSVHTSIAIVGVLVIAISFLRYDHPEME